MKKMFGLVILLGAIAIISVSFLAEAEPKTTTVTTEITTTATTPTQPAPVADKLAVDTAECTAASSVAKADSTLPTDAEKSASIKTCLETKGHKQEHAETIAPTVITPEQQ